MNQAASLSFRKVCKIVWSQDPEEPLSSKITKQCLNCSSLLGKKGQLLKRVLFLARFHNQAELSSPTNSGSLKVGKPKLNKHGHLTKCQGHCIHPGGLFNDVDNMKFQATCTSIKDKFWWKNWSLKWITVCQWVNYGNILRSHEASI